jgi:uncharacterized protein YeaC (DUF1315 family)
MTREELEAEAIRRMLRILETGAWPSGLRLTPAERRTVEWNLELARRQPALRAMAIRR